MQVVQTLQELGEKLGPTFRRHLGRRLVEAVSGQVFHREARPFGIIIEDAHEARMRKASEQANFLTEAGSGIGGQVGLQKFQGDERPLVFGSCQKDPTHPALA